jgi:hypothetical protein
MDFAPTLIQVARSYDGTTETSYNSGPHIDDWLKAVHCHPGDAWCAAALCAWIAETEKQLGIVFDFNPSASALSLLELNPHLVVAVPQPGDLAIFCHDRPKHLGHAGLVTSTISMNSDLASFSFLSGNTFKDASSREGNTVAEHPAFARDPKLAGFLRLAIR